MKQEHHDFVANRYGPRAGDYVSSAVHSSGKDLAYIESVVIAELATRRASEPRRDSAAKGESEARGAALRVLDLGCGGGHVSYRVAPHVAEVVAVDPSAEMLEAVRRAAAERDLRNLKVERCAAEALPFPDGAFDLVLSRFSAHHWSDLDAGLREARRVLGRLGRAVFVDSISPGRPLLDTHLQAIELLRDETHVRNYSAAEWQAALIRAGFTVVSTATRTLRLEFSSWVERTRTPDTLARAIRLLQDGAPEEVREHFRLEADGSFRLEALTTDASGA